MFNFSGSELVFFVLIALVVLGPDKLPEAMRKAGKAYADFKKMTSGFQNEMRSVLDEPMRELRETAELAKQAASWDTSLIPPTKPVSDSMANHSPAFESVVVPKVIVPPTEAVEPAPATPAAPQEPSPAPATTSATPITAGAAAPTPVAVDATTRRLAAQPPTSEPSQVAPQPLKSPNFGSAAPRIAPTEVPAE